ncbi:MAG: DUF1638 domain-containing protein [Lachnospiraceae bacterium]|nr:DUF1638 domain-containing protein [Lachnospiraceae bacterium]
MTLINQPNEGGLRVLLACDMLKNELQSLLEKGLFEGEVVWMEKGLHEYPDQLRTALQEEIDKWDEKADQILLAYGLCGNGLLGLTSHHASLVIPNFDDCIRCLLSTKAGMDIPMDPSALYYTAGWLDLEDSMLSENTRYMQTYGPVKGLKIIKSMFKHYKYVRMVETGQYDVDDAIRQVTPMAEKIGLECRREPGSLRVYKEFLKGNVSDEFIITKPGETIGEAHFANRARCDFDHKNLMS